MKRWLHWAGVAVSIACLGFFIRALAGHWQALAALDLGGLTGAALAAMLLYLLTYVLAAKAWQLGLGMFAIRASFRTSTRILLLSQIGKYLPGNLGHHIGRVVLARQLGLKTDAVIASMLLDTALVLMAGALCSLPAASLLLQAADGPLAGVHPVLPWAASAIGLAVLAVFASSRARRRLRGWLPTMFAPSPAALMGIVACHALSFILGASALYVLCQALAAAGVTTALGQVVGVYAAAWVLGFVMPGSPAGLGVRELVLLLGLAPIYGASDATAAAALLRLVTVGGDGVAFAVGTVFPRRWGEP